MILVSDDSKPLEATTEVQMYINDVRQSAEVMSNRTFNMYVAHSYKSMVRKKIIIDLYMYVCRKTVYIQTIFA